MSHSLTFFNIERFRGSKLHTVINVYLFFLEPEHVEVEAKSTSSMLVTITPPEETSGITFYRASTGDSSCQVMANVTSLICSITGLPAGSKFDVEAVACTSNSVCSAPISGQGYTLPDGMVKFTRSALLKARFYLFFFF